MRFLRTRDVTWSVQKPTTVIAAAARSDQSVRVSGKRAGMTTSRQPKRAMPWKIDASARQRMRRGRNTEYRVERTPHAASDRTNRALAASTGGDSHENERRKKT